MRNRIARSAASLLMTIFCVSAGFSVPLQAASTVKITVSPALERSDISPYIYGVNNYSESSGVTVNSIRQGGNRLTAYNWENNFSNAGSDWYNSSDTYLSSSSVPGKITLDLAAAAKKNNIAMTIATLQMAGYVSADGNGNVTEAAPSSRWNKVVFEKDGAFSLSPDLTDGTVYMDEYVNYLVNKLGSSSNGGITAYSLDNEPALWCGTHSLVVTSPITCSELLKKSASLAAAVKKIDPKALVFGPALYGFEAYTSLQGAPDWDTEKGDCSWFIDYYLSKMKTASASAGTRLLDVLDLHFYSEAQGSCGTRVTECSNSSHSDCLEARMQAPRTLYDSKYSENSWIGQWRSQYLPLIQTVQKSIDKYYPDTKLAFTEYNLGGGNHVSGAVAEADALGAFGKYDVYCANLWPLSDDCKYQFAAINLFTNYDGNGSSFGDISVKAESDDIAASTAYASVDGKETLRLIATNKNVSSDLSATITIDSQTKYSSAECYGITSAKKEVAYLGSVASISGNSFTYTLPAMSVVEFVFTSSGTPVITTSAQTSAETSPTAESTSDSATETETQTSETSTVPQTIPSTTAMTTHTETVSSVPESENAIIASTISESSDEITTAGTVITNDAGGGSDGQINIPLIIGAAAAGVLIIAGAIVIAARKLK